ncbi:MAG: hypothetical protein R3Y06_02690 [Faecalibacterium sp.]
MNVEVPLLPYFQKGNEYSAAVQGMRYFLSPRKETVLDENGNPVLDEKKKEKTIAKLDVTIWPDPWALNRTDPALRQLSTYLLTEEGRTAAMEWLVERYQAEFERWQECPNILDSEPWYPVPAQAAEG